MNYGRGPDTYELKVARFLRAEMALRNLEHQLLQALDERLEAEKQLGDEKPYGPELRSLVQMRRGDAFWDRTPLEAAPRRELTPGS